MMNKIDALNLFLGGLLIGVTICNIRDYGYNNLNLLFILMALVGIGISLDSLTKR